MKGRGVWEQTQTRPVLTVMADPHPSSLMKTHKDDTKMEEEHGDINPEVQGLLEVGIQCLEEGNNEEAAEILSSAIELDNKCALLYINRAAAYARLGNFTDALEDCEMAVELRPDWPEAYMRKGTVLLELYRHRHAHCAFTAGHELEPTNERLGKGKFEALTRLQTKDSVFPKVSYGPLQDKSVQIALKKDPKTKHLMEDPVFVEIIEEIRKNPKAMLKYTCQGDYKVSTCVAVAQSCDVNLGEQDFLDEIYPGKHKKLVEHYGGYPWTPDYSPVREIYIPPPRPKTPERPIPPFEQGWNISMHAL